MHPKDYYVRFTGKYSDLKFLGYHFQKLFAANYQQWNKDDLRIWRKGQDVTHDSWSDKFPTILNTLISLDINNLRFEPSVYFKGLSLFKLYVNSETYECTSDNTEFWSEKRRIHEAVKANKDIEDNLWQELVLTPESIKLCLIW